MQKDRQTLPGNICGWSVMMLWRAKIWYSTKRRPKLLGEPNFFLEIYGEKISYMSLCVKMITNMIIKTFLLL
jgi:hypothetical protein